MKRTADRLVGSGHPPKCPRMASREIGAEAEVVLTVMPASTAARPGLKPGEVYPEVLATRTMVGETDRDSEIALPRRRSTS